MSGETKILEYAATSDRTPWSAERPSLLWRGVWSVLRHPSRTLRAAEDSDAVTLRRAATFALLFAMAFLILAALREFLLSVHVFVLNGAADGIAAPFTNTIDELRQWRRWWQPVLWLAWAQVKWWCLFSLLALALPSPRRRARRRLPFVFCALALFSPWFFLLDVMCSMTVWAAAGSCVPEPNTMWPYFGDDLGWFIRFWTIRLIVPLPLIVALFLHGALGWQRRTSVLAGVLMVLPVGVLWTLWDQFLLFQVFARLS